MKVFHVYIDDLRFTFVDPEPVEELKHRIVEASRAAGAFVAITQSSRPPSEVFVTEGRARALRVAFPDVAAVDMESAAIAQFAHVHDMPFVSVRCISDLCAPDGAEFREHLDDAAARAARVVHDLVLGLRS